ncbi:phage-like baseplate assembly protein [Burkholderia lata]|uniref:type VI secretion system Vgr family protein n=1 Tax=Burkholderia lata (strain ATCC 17760 / DSM 23089 / LMG 22485 / NCIMB 9086 / R18194 / 383) TaxID=482957 RepID=UPI001453AA8C|nr:type VI secretion system Vgr family protein [Burkholderia lata]VWC92778.1 phage-like baseplate assembly protein [Burkholderia lata]
MNPTELVRTVSAQFPNFERLLSGFTQSRRLLQVTFTHSMGLPDDAVLPHQLIASEGVCEPLRFTLQALSSDVSMPLKAFIGAPVAFQVGDIAGAERTICAIVCEARQLAADGGFVLYEFVCTDALSLLDRRVTWRVFRDASVVDISHTIIQEHTTGNQIIGAAFRLDTSALGAYPSRGFTMQAKESDFAFMTRMWRREGISWYFTHAIENGEPIHTLHLVDNADAWRANPAGLVRFNRADATEPNDTIFAWEAYRELAPGGVVAASHDYQTGGVEQLDAATSQDQGEHGKALAATLTQYWYDSPHVAENSGHYEQVMQRRQLALTQGAKHFAGQSVVRAFVGGAGTTFSLSGHPEIDRHSTEDRRFVLTHIETRARNSLLLNSPAKGAFSIEDDAPILNRFECVRASTQIVPTWNASCVPSVGPISARVVGNGEVDVDEQGRICVQFLFARRDDHPDSGASGSLRDSARVRVAQPWADAQSGTAFWPRVGSEVLVLFMQNDPDKPIVVANMFDARHAPVQFASAGNLPDNAPLYGIRSKEIGGLGYGELQFDDTTGQTKTKLSSEHGKTQLNQGWIGHPRDKGASEKRGEGFELRTDLAGTIRAARGMLLTTDGRNNANGRVLDRAELIGQLELALSIAKRLGELSATHDAYETDTDPQEKLTKGIRDWSDDGGAAAIGITAPDGIAMSSPANVVSAAGGHVESIAAQDANISAGRRILLRAAQGLSAFAKAGMKLMVGSGDLTIQAHQGKGEIGTSERLHIYSLEKLVLEAPELELRTNGAVIKLENGKIVSSSSSEHRIESSSFQAITGGGGSTDLAPMPTSSMRTDERFKIVGPDGKPHVGLSHNVTDDTGGIRDQGKLAADGTHSLTVNDSEIRPVTFRPVD